MDKRQRYIARVHEVCPDLLVEAVTLDVEGQNNDILVVNDEVIFRFPKYDEGVKRLEIETAILTGIQRYLTTVSVPNPIYVSLAKTVGQAFMGYRMIRGELATADDFVAFKQDDMHQSVAAQLATFLRELHGVPVTEAININLPLSDTRLEWTETYARIRDNLFPHMRLDAQESTAQHFETFLNDGRNFVYEPVMRHGDIGPGNIVVDKESWSVNGVLDFGSAGLGDPAVDVAWIQYRSGVGESFLKKFYAAYPEIETTLERAQFYAGTFALQEALFGIENNDAEAFRRGIATYA